MKDVCWTRLKLSLHCDSVRGKSLEPAEAVFQSVFKNVWNRCSFAPESKFVFHPADNNLIQTIRENRVYSFYLVFNDSESYTGDTFASVIHRILDESEKNPLLPYLFKLCSVSACEKRTATIVKNEQEIVGHTERLILDFISPLNLKTKKRKARDWDIPSGDFIKLFMDRLTSFFNLDFSPEIQDTESFCIEPYYWNYSGKNHKSKTNNGYVFLNGLKGFLPVNGINGKLLDLFLICSDIHAGGRTAYGMGVYTIKSGFSFFDKKLTGVHFINSVITKMLAKHEGKAGWLEMILEGNNAGRIIDRINENYTHEDYKGCELEKESGKTRMILLSQPVDHVIEKAVSMLLEPVFERMWEKQSFGFRRGLSREDAKQRITEKINEGYLWVFDADIESFFDSVEWDVIMEKVKKVIPEGDTITFRIIEQTIKAPFTFNSIRMIRTKGLPTGSPLSPLLANLLLDNFDETMTGQGYCLIRYADDFIVMAKSEEEALQAWKAAETILSGLKLSLNSSKTGIKEIACGFTFLGYDFPGEMNPELLTESLLYKTLYIREQGCFTGMEGDIITIKRGRKILSRLPFNRVKEIIVLGNSSISTFLLHRCSAEKIPVTFCSSAGYHINTLSPDSRAFYSLSAAHYGRYNALTEQEKAAIAANIAQAKFINYLSFFSRHRHEEQTALLQELRDIMEKLEAARTIPQIFGYEGAGSKIIFKLTWLLLNNPVFKSHKRERKNPDPFNSLYNFGSYLLFTRCNAIVRSFGLNPYLGFLHSKDDSYESLVCDIMEPFRFRVTRLIMRLVNRKEITENHFTRTESGWWLKNYAVKEFIQAFEGELLYTIKGDPGNCINLIKAQVLSLINWTKSGSSIKIYTRQR